MKVVDNERGQNTTISIVMLLLRSFVWLLGSKGCVRIVSFSDFNSAGIDPDISHWLGVGVDRLLRYTE